VKIVSRALRAARWTRGGGGELDSDVAVLFQSGEAGLGVGSGLLDAMRVGTTEGMQHFDGEIERLIRAGTIDLDTGLGYATNPGNLRLELADFVPPPEALPAPNSE